MSIDNCDQLQAKLNSIHVLKAMNNAKLVLIWTVSEHYCCEKKIRSRLECWEKCRELGENKLQILVRQGAGKKTRIVLVFLQIFYFFTDFKIIFKLFGATCFRYLVIWREACSVGLIGTAAAGKK